MRPSCQRRVGALARESMTAGNGNPFLSTPLGRQRCFRLAMASGLRRVFESSCGRLPRRTSSAALHLVPGVLWLSPVTRAVSYLPCLTALACLSASRQPRCSARCLTVLAWAPNC